MNESSLEIADIFRRYGAQYRAKYGPRLSPEQREVIRDIVQCRTPALGAYVLQCDKLCGYEEVVFRSCRNRHCPKCGGQARAQWLEAQAANVLAGIPYFHVVFTIPAALAAVAFQTRTVFFRIYFKAVAETLQTIARDPKHLGAQIGFLAIMHSWSQVLLFHPHIHCLVPGGGLSSDGTCWRPCRMTRKGKHFFVPVRVLSKMFRLKMLDYLTKAYKKDQLSFHGTLESLSETQDWKKLLSSVKKTGWTVYAKPPFRSTDQVLKYLARYVNRVAISNKRVVSIDDGKVAFRWRDRANSNKLRTMTLDAHEFIRRFILHVFPKGFQRIRYYGFLANCHRKKKLSLCRGLLGIPTDQTTPSDASSLLAEFLTDRVTCEDHDKADQCPACKEGRLRRRPNLPPDDEYACQVTRFLAYDTS